MSAEPTFGRYAEIPLDQMTPQQREGYDRVVESRGEAPGPYKIFIQNPALMHVVVPVGVYFNNGHSSLSGAEREIAVNLINATGWRPTPTTSTRSLAKRPACRRTRSKRSLQDCRRHRRPAATGDLRPDPGVDRFPRCTYWSVPARRGPTGRCWRHRSDDAPRLLHDGVADAGGLQRSRRRRRLEAVTVTT